MASHKRAGAGVTITTSLPPNQVADICKQTADQTASKSVVGVSQHVRLEEATPGKLRFSIRSMNDRLEQMVFDVTLGQRNGHQQVNTQITRYKTRQQKALHFIPMGPKQMNGLRTYEAFVDRLQSAVRAADSAATAIVR